MTRFPQVIGSLYHLRHPSPLRFRSSLCPCPRPTLTTPPCKIYVIAGVYRLWMCTGGDLDDLGIASIYKEYHGGRDFWFERKHLSSRVCEFEGAPGDDGADGGRGLNLTFGAIPYDPDVSENS